jgi:phage baseplate assembly protein gpV
VINPQSIHTRSNGRTVVLTYDPLSAGDYTLSIDQFQVKDLVGNPMGSGSFESRFKLLEATVSWIGGSGFWDEPSNWSTGVVPGATDIVLIDAPGATVTYRQADTTIAGLILQTELVVSGGLTITGAALIDGILTLPSTPILVIDGTMTVNGTLNWAGGLLTGAGTTTIAPSGSLLISGDITNKLLNSHTLNNAGSTTWSGLGGFVLDRGAVFNNSGTFRDQNENNHTIFFFFEGGSTFNNSGTFIKSGGTGSTAMGEGIGFTNTGMVDIQTGTLSVRAGSSSGTFNTAAGASVVFAGGNFSLNAGTTFTGAGLGRVGGGTLDVNAGVNAPSFELASGTLRGTGTLTITNTFTWTGGTMSGSGITVIPDTATFSISGNANKFLDQRTLNNSGTATWSGLGSLFMSNGAIINNSGSLDAQNNQSIVENIGVGTFNNSGTFTKSTVTGTTTISSGIALNNTGTVEVLTGTLTISSNTTNSAGILKAGAAGTLSITGTYTQTAGGSLNIDIGGTTAGTTFGRVTITGSVTLAGTLNLARVNNFVANLGDVFQIMTFASRVGQFATVNGLDAGNGHSFSPNYNNTNVTLTVV